jgi:hypothetical protein
MRQANNKSRQNVCGAGAKCNNRLLKMAAHIELTFSAASPKRFCCCCRFHSTSCSTDQLYIYKPTGKILTWAAHRPNGFFSPVNILLRFVSLIAYLISRDCSSKTTCNQIQHNYMLPPLPLDGTKLATINGDLQVNNGRVDCQAKRCAPLCR